MRIPFSLISFLPAPFPPFHFPLAGSFLDGSVAVTSAAASSVTSGQAFAAMEAASAALPAAPAARSDGPNHSEAIALARMWQLPLQSLS